MERRWMVLVGAALLAACDGSGETAPISSTRPVSTQLASSQTSASTIEAPELPPPCSAGQLTFAEGDSDEPGVLFVDITNTGDERCEANLSRSVAVAPEMEPDVWIDPGATAQLRVELDTTSCESPAPVDTLGLDVNGAPVAVGIARVDVCTLALTALYPA